MTLGLFLGAMFVGGMTSGVAGFAMGLVVSGICLHILPPMENAALIVGYSVVTQSYGIWKLRHALNWRQVSPLMIGGAIGAPAGAALLTAIDPATLRGGVGILLVLYGAYGLVRPRIRPIHAGRPTDFAVGFFNGLLGGLTGLAGIIVAVYCQLRDWTKDVQRAVFQPVTLSAALFSLASLGAAGALTGETVKHYLLGLPFMAAGVWSGFHLYGRLDDAAFRKVILALLLLSGLTLIAPALLLGR